MNADARGSGVRLTGGSKSSDSSWSSVFQGFSPCLRGEDSFWQFLSAPIRVDPRL